MADLITTIEAAALLGYKYSESIHHLRKSQPDFPAFKKIVPYKNGRRMLFSRAEVLAWGEAARKQGLIKMRLLPPKNPSDRTDFNEMALSFITRPRVASL